MKRNYAAGEETKKLIYTTCKKLFYEKGIEHTSYVNISSVAGINKSLIPYHFSSKNDIAKLVYDEVEQNIDSIVEDFYHNESNLFRSFASLYLFHNLIRDNSNYRLFCAQLLSLPEYMKENLQAQITFFNSFIDEIPIPPSKERIHTIAAMSNGLDIELITGIHEKYVTESVDVVFRLDASFILQQFGLTNNEINTFIDKIIHINTRLQMNESFAVSIKMEAPPDWK